MAAATSGKRGISNQRRSYTFKGFVRDLGHNAASLPRFLGIYAFPSRMDKQLREKIMFSISRMNACRHCTAIHGAWADLVGLSESDRAALHDLDPAEFDNREWTALEYARRLVADEAGEMDPDLERALAGFFTKDEIADIAAVARGINLANRCSNTWDVFLDRLRGEPADDSSLANELAVLAVCAPVGPFFLLLSDILQRRQNKPQPDTE